MFMRHADACTCHYKDVIRSDILDSYMDTQISLFHLFGLRNWLVDSQNGFFSAGIVWRHIITSERLTPSSADDDNLIWCDGTLNSELYRYIYVCGNWCIIFLYTICLGLLLFSVFVCVYNENLHALWCCANVISIHIVIRAVLSKYIRTFEWKFSLHVGTMVLLTMSHGHADMVHDIPWSRCL